MFITKKLILLLTLFSIWFVSFQAQARHPKCDEFDQLFYSAEAYHLNSPTMTEEIIIRGGKMYIKYLDPYKILLTKSEYNKIISKLEKNSDKYLSDFYKKKCNLFKELIDEPVKVGNDRYHEMIKAALKLSPKKFKADALEKRGSVKEIEKAVQEEIRNYLFENKENLAEVRKYILDKNAPVKNSDPDEKNTILIKAFLNTLDPHSTYFTPSEWKQFTSDTNASMIGFGFQGTRDFQGVKILGILKDSPLDKSKKLEPGDHIISVNEKIMKKIEDIISIIEENPVGSEFEIEALKKDKSIIKFKIKSAKFAQSSLKVSSELKKINNKTILLLKVPSFYYDSSIGAGTAEDVFKAYNDAKKDTKIDLILMDFRNNSGGLLEQAQRLIGVFVGNKIAVFVKGKDGNALPAMTGFEKPVIAETPVVILENKLSASASEIVSGALKDYGRALILGDKTTYGKGSVQQIYPHPNSIGLGTLKFTISQFYLPGGDSTQLRGVSSHIVIPGPYKDSKIGEFTNEYSLSFDKLETAEKITPISVDTNKLAKQSKDRVSKNKDFKNKKFESDTGSDIVLSESLEISNDYLTLLMAGKK